MVKTQGKTYGCRPEHSELKGLVSHFTTNNKGEKTTHFFPSLSKQLNQVPVYRLFTPVLNLGPYILRSQVREGKSTV